MSEQKPPYNRILPPEPDYFDGMDDPVPGIDNLDPEPPSDQVQPDLFPMAATINLILIICLVIYLYWSHH